MFAGSYFETLTINPVSILTRPVPMTQRIMVNPKVAIRHRMTETWKGDWRSAKTSLPSEDQAVSIWGIELSWDWPPIVFHPCDKLTGWTNWLYHRPWTRVAHRSVIDPWTMPSGQRILTLFWSNRAGAYAAHGFHYWLGSYLTFEHGLWHRSQDAVFWLANLCWLNWYLSLYVAIVINSLMQYCWLEYAVSLNCGVRMELGKYCTVRGTG